MENQVCRPKIRPPDSQDRCRVSAVLAGGASDTESVPSGSGNSRRRLRQLATGSGPRDMPVSVV